MLGISGGLDKVRNIIGSGTKRVAIVLNRLSGGRLHPNTITLVGLFAHLPIAYLIATAHPLRAAALLVIFGLFDTLDGTLARLQKRASSSGMLLDATTDRAKEVILYCGVAYHLVAFGQAYWAVWAVAAVGGSLLVSYVKAKGETAIADTKLSPNQINRLFQDGLARFEVRMFVLIVGLLSGQLIVAIVLVSILSWATATMRLIKISGRLENTSDKN